MKKITLLLNVILFSVLVFAQDPFSDSDNSNPTRGGDFLCSGVVVNACSATVTLCSSDYNPNFPLDQHPTTFNVVLPSNLQYGLSGTLTLLNTSYIDSLVICEVDANNNTLRRIRFTSADNGIVSFPAQYTTGRFVFNIFCYNLGVGTSAGFSITISPLEQTQMEYACATYLGVGTCSPLKTLHVNGELMVSNPQNPSASLTIQPTASAINFQSYSPPIYFNQKVLSQCGFYSSSFFNLTLGTNNTPRMTILNSNGNVGIGTTTPMYKLDVAGEIRSDSIRTQAITVEIPSGADFVFDKRYDLRSLEEVKSFIETNGHLPEIQSAEDMQTNGVNISDFQIKLLQKIEELTLYIIKQEEKIERLKQQVDSLSK